MYTLGVALGWIEFLVLGVGAGLALLSAVPFVVGGHALTIEREVEPERVQVGDRATSGLRVTNTGKKPSAARIVEDRVGEIVKVIDVPGLAPGASFQGLDSLPTQRRGVISLGPAVIAKTDPLGLLRRDLGRTKQSQLWVHPRYGALRPLHSGFVKDLEGPTHDTSPAGDIAFHAIREYQRGDDIRHIHWMSTARHGDLMVRHYVDNRRPHLGVLAEGHPEALAPDMFERALEAVASQVVSATLDGRPIAAWVGRQQIVTAQKPGTSRDALDRLSLSFQDDEAPDALDTYRTLQRTDTGVSAFVLITGGRSATELLPVVTEATRNGGVLVFRFVDAGTPAIAVPKARVIDCCDLRDFVAAWGALVR